MCARDWGWPTDSVVKEALGKWLCLQPVTNALSFWEMKGGIQQPNLVTKPCTTQTGNWRWLHMLKQWVKKVVAFLRLTNRYLQLLLLVSIASCGVVYFWQLNVILFNIIEVIGFSTAGNGRMGCLSSWLPAITTPLSFALEEVTMSKVQVGFTQTNLL